MSDRLRILVGFGGQRRKLNIFIWTEYVPDSVIESLRMRPVSKVNVSTFSSNEDMLAKVQAEASDAYDIVQPSDYMVQRMIEQDMLAGWIRTRCRT